MGDRALSPDEPYGEAVAELVGENDNFYKIDDGTLSGIYTVAEFDGAFGTEGLQGTPPANFEEHRVEWVDGHDRYWDYETGCIRSVVTEWRDRDPTPLERDPAASGPVGTHVSEPTVTTLEGALDGSGASTVHTVSLQGTAPSRVVEGAALQDRDSLDVRVAAPGEGASTGSRERRDPG